MILIKSYLMKF